MNNTVKNSVLIADDDTSNLIQLCQILQPEYIVYTAGDGVTALEIAEKSSPDLILLDIVMPGMSGFEVLTKLKKSETTKEIPVIFITGMSDSYNESEGFSLGAADYIRKPFNDMVVKLRVRHQIQIINLQRNLESAVRTAEAANKSKSDFLAKMSHEIRTPLNVILGLSDIQLQNDNLPQDMSEVFIKISNSGELLLRVINDILDMSKIETGVLELTPTQYDTASFINDTVLLNMVKFKEKPIEFIIAVDENLPSSLIGDELRIKQILNNILSNAFKYTRTGEVELSVAAEHGDGIVTLVFRVRDTGQGMTREQLDRLFDEYSRFSAESNLMIEGVGLGMNITQNLVAMMDGEISVESEPDKGSLFTVRLPQRAINCGVLGKTVAENLQQFHVKSMAKRKQIKHELMPYGKVLIVDDMMANLDIAEALLSLYELQIETATSGHDTIEKIKGGSLYDIIFMDHRMPGKDGVETAEHLRGMGYTNPIVMLTANAVAGQAEVVLQKGFDDFLSKPIDVFRLDAVLNKFIRDKRR